MGIIISEISLRTGPKAGIIGLISKGGIGASELALQCAVISKIAFGTRLDAGQIGGIEVFDT